MQLVDTGALVNSSVSPIAMILNGLLAFLSPCILPMLPIYAAYIIGNNTGSESKINKAMIMRLLGLVAGFISVFVIMGAIAGFAGSKSGINRELLNIISNALLIVFGLMMLEIIPGLQLGSIGADASKYTGRGFFQNMLFGAILVLSWTPCLTPLLGNALIMAASSTQATALNGIYLLALFALGLSVPMVIIMLLYQKLSGMVNFLKKYHHRIRQIAGLIMLIIGVVGLITIIF